MKRSELKIGMEVAVTNGSGRYDRRLHSSPATRAEVVGIGDEYTPAGWTPGKTTGIRIRWLAPWGRNRIPGVAGAIPAEIGQEVVIPALCIWMPWDRYEQERTADEDRRQRREDEWAAEDARAIQAVAALGVGSWVRGRTGVEIALTIADAEALVKRLPTLERN